MSNLYKQYLRLLKQWPINESKSVDLGRHLRDEFKKTFGKDDTSILTKEFETRKYLDKDLEEKCRKQLESLERLATDFYAKKYPVKIKSTATGIPPEICAKILSTEFEKVLQSQKLGTFSKLKMVISNTLQSLKRSK